MMQTAASISATVGPSAVAARAPRTDGIDRVVS